MDGPNPVVTLLHGSRPSDCFSRWICDPSWLNLELVCGFSKFEVESMFSLSSCLIGSEVPRIVPNTG